MTPTIKFDYELQMLSGLAFSSSANLYVNSGCGFDCLKGIKAIDIVWRLDVEKKEREWKFILRDKSGRSGELAFSLPKIARTFSVDMAPGNKLENTSGPVLYNEFRLAGPVRASGVFGASMKGRPIYNLILHGRGGNCPGTKGFENWTLMIDGSHADYRFFGKLREQ